jgi:hypothetical protein
MISGDIFKHTQLYSIKTFTRTAQERRRPSGWEPPVVVDGACWWLSFGSPPSPFVFVLGNSYLTEIFCDFFLSVSLVVRLNAEIGYGCFFPFLYPSTSHCHLIMVITSAIATATWKIFMEEIGCLNVITSFACYLPRRLYLNSVKSQPVLSDDKGNGHLT